MVLPGAIWHWLRFVLCLLVLSLLSACREQSVLAGKNEVPTGMRTFAGRGVIQQVELSKGQLTIQHEAIPGFMEAMTMPFRVESTHRLQGLKTGDQITFQLFVTEQTSWIDHIRKTGQTTTVPIPPPTTALGTSAASPHHPLLDYPFTNELGQIIRIRDFRGQALALTFIFTRCPIPDYCPRLSQNFAEACQRLKASSDGPTNWHFFSVSFDTQHDTPSVLKAYGERYHYDPAHWSFLTGPADKISELARLSDMTYQPEASLFTHNLRTLIIDTTGTLRMNFPIGGNLSEAIAEEIVKASTNPNKARMYE